MSCANVKNLAADSDVFRGLDGHHKMAAIELGLVEQVNKEKPRGERGAP